MEKVNKIFSRKRKKKLKDKIESKHKYKHKKPKRRRKSSCSKPSHSDVCEISKNPCIVIKNETIISSYSLPSKASTLKQCNVPVKFFFQLKSDSFDPLLVSFPSGVPFSLKSTPRLIKTKTSDEDETTSSMRTPIMVWKLQQDCPKSLGDNQKMELIGTDSVCKYTYKRIPNAHKWMNTIIGVFDKLQHTVTLIPTLDRTIFPMYQNIISSIDNTLPKSDFGSKLPHNDQKRSLLESFGTVKSQKTFKMKNDSKVVNMENILGDENEIKALFEKERALMSDSNRKVLETIRKCGSDGKKEVLEAAYIDARRLLLPPFDIDADSPNKIYNAKKLAGKCVWNHISQKVENVQKDMFFVQWKAITKGFEALMRRPHHLWAKSIRNILYLRRQKSENALTLSEVTTIVILSHLLQFHEMCFNKTFLFGSTEELSKYFGISFIVCSNFLTVFASPVVERGKNGFNISSYQKDKLNIYTLVLYILIYELKVESINDICDDLKIEIHYAVDLLKEAGFQCYYKKKKTGDFLSVNLNVPLTFPPIKNRKISSTSV